MSASPTDQAGQGVGRFEGFEPVDLAGSVFVDASTAQLEVRDSSDGHLLATIPGAPTWWLLASDGSYVCAGNPQGLTVWSTSGQVLLSHPGDYSKVAAFAAPGQVNIANGPAGQHVIESISVAAGTSSVSPAYQGNCNSWFADGAGFLTTLGTTVWIYSPAAAQEDIKQLPSLNSESLAGQGSWFWTIDPNGTVNIYKVEASASPALTANMGIGGIAIASGGTIGLLQYGNGQLNVVDLSGSTPVLSPSYAVPIAYLQAYAATSATQWVVGNRNGVVLDGASISGTPRYLTLGSVWSIAGGSQYFAVATASGTIFYYRLGRDHTARHDQFLGIDTFTVLRWNGVGGPRGCQRRKLRARCYRDGLLATFGGAAQQLPGDSGSTRCTGQYRCAGDHFSVWCGKRHRRGTGLVADMFGAGDSVSTGTQLWCDPQSPLSNALPTVQVSPDGTLITADSSIYKNGTLVTTVTGTSVGWLDNNSFLAMPAGGNGDAITYSSTGANLGSTSLIYPALHFYSFQPVTASAIYVPFTNQILSLTTGQPTWSSGPDFTGIGAVSGTQVIYGIQNYVIQQPY